MKKLILWWLLAFLAQPLIADEVDIFRPTIFRPTIKVPEVVTPRTDVLVDIFRPTIFRPTIKVPEVVTPRTDVLMDEVFDLTSERWAWRKTQQALFNEWKDKTTFLITRAETPDIDFFTAKQVVISNIKHDWRLRFTPSKGMVWSIDFSPSTIEVSALLDMISELRADIKLIILPYGEDVNNFDLKTRAEMEKVTAWADRLNWSIKEIAPEIPIYKTVSYVELNMATWINSFKAQYDGIALWNLPKIPNDTELVSTIYRRVSRYSRDIVWMVYGGDTELAKSAGFKGVVYIE